MRTDRKFTEKIIKNISLYTPIPQSASRSKSTESRKKLQYIQVKNKTQNSQLSIIPHSKPPLTIFQKKRHQL